MLRKYNLTEETKIIECLDRTATLHRIRALRDFGDVKAGDLGGWVEHEGNLSQYGNCWVYDEGIVYNQGVVCGNGVVRDQGLVCGDGIVFDDGVVCGDGMVSGHGVVWGDGVVTDFGAVTDYGVVCDNGKVSGHGVVWGRAWVSDNGMVSDNGIVSGNGRVSDNGEILKPEHIFVIGPAGSRNDYTTFYRTNRNQIGVTCGCFSGTIDDFLQKVQETHGDTKYGIVYKQAAELAKAQIDLS